MKIISEPNYLTAAGLIFDVFGASLLVKAIFFNSVASIRKQASSTWDDNYELRYALCEQRVDAWFGLPLLCVGFLIQLAGAFFAPRSEVPLALVVLLVAVLAAYYLGRRNLVIRLVQMSKPENEEVAG